MNSGTLLIQLLLAGFFAVACVRAHGPVVPGARVTLGDLFRLPGRRERLRRSRWPWFSMVAVMLVLRLQEQLPVVLEVTAALEFALFLALPTRATTQPSVSR